MSMELNENDYNEGKDIIARIRAIDPSFKYRWELGQYVLTHIYSEEFPSLRGLRNKLDQIELPHLIRQCKSPSDFRKLFQDLGVADKNLRNVQWMIQRAKKPQDKNGIERNLQFLVDEVRNSLFENWADFISYVFEEKNKFSWKIEVDQLRSKEDFFAFFKKVGIDFQQYRSSKSLVAKGYAGLVSAIKRDIRFHDSWQYFRACMDGQLPFDGIQSVEHAKDLFDQEIRRLRTDKPNEPITQEERDTFARIDMYKNNIVVRAVVDFLNSPKIDI